MTQERASRDDQVDGAYADRPYERRLSQSGRRIVSLDLDEDLLRTIDVRRGSDRRGLHIDALIRAALAIEEPVSMA